MQGAPTPHVRPGPTESGVLAAWDTGPGHELLLEGEWQSCHRFSKKSPEPHKLQSSQGRRSQPGFWQGRDSLFKAERISSLQLQTLSAREREELSPERKHSPPGPAAAAYIYPGQQPQPTPHGLCCPPTFRSWSALHLLLLTCPTPFPLTCGLSALLPEHGHRWAWVTHSLLLDAVASPPKPCCCHPPCINSFCKRVTCWFNKSLVIVIIYWLP